MSADVRYAERMTEQTTDDTEIQSTDEAATGQQTEPVISDTVVLEDPIPSDTVVVEGEPLTEANLLAMVEAAAALTPEGSIL